LTQAVWSKEMKLDLRFTSRPPFAVWCEAVAGFIHEGSFIEEENMAGVDQKTSAYLRALNKRGFCKAEIGETLLLPGEDRLMAKKVVLKGLGPKDQITPELFLSQVAGLAACLRDLGVISFAVKIPLLFGVDQYHEQVRHTVQEAVNPFLAGSKGEDDEMVTAVFSVERTLLGEISEVESLLRNYFKDIVPFSLVIEPPGGKSEI